MQKLFPMTSNWPVQGYSAENWCKGTSSSHFISKSKREGVQCFSSVAFISHPLKTTRAFGDSYRTCKLRSNKSRRKYTPRQMCPEIFCYHIISQQTGAGYNRERSFIHIGVRRKQQKNARTSYCDSLLSDRDRNYTNECFNCTRGCPTLENLSTKFAGLKLAHLSMDDGYLRLWC